MNLETNEVSKYCAGFIWGITPLCALGTIIAVVTAVIGVALKALSYCSCLVKNEREAWEWSDLGADFLNYSCLFLISSVPIVGGIGAIYLHSKHMVPFKKYAELKD